MEKLIRNAKLNISNSPCKRDFCISYESFKNKLDEKIRKGSSFYIELLRTVIDNPCRYIGVFRLSNPKTKLKQNVTQSIEIKFGDFMEDIMTDYIAYMGYTNISKWLGVDENGDALDVDQIFMNDNDELFIIEQKIRDDHDSTKKRGQIDNFIKKHNCVSKKYEKKKISAIMWFIDPSLTKNKKYYKEEIGKLQKQYPNSNFHLCYGEELFEDVFEKKEIWQEIIEHLKLNKLQRNKNELIIPDFDTSAEMFEALKELSVQEVKKLFSDKLEYRMLRDELFPTKTNFIRLKKYYEEIGDMKKCQLLIL